MNRYRYPAIPESEVTPRELLHTRRRVLKGGLALGAAAVAPGLLWPREGQAWQGLLEQRLATGLPSQELAGGESPTSLRDITTYNNFYELGTGKRDPEIYGHQLVTDPWSLAIEGEVDKAGTFALEDVLKHQDLEERIYRLRCVEAWSKVIPWVGFPLADLLKRHEPTSRARYVVFETIHDPDNLRGQRRGVLDWPYREVLRIDEAMHPLTLMAVGLYGEVLPNQSGAPIRLVVPWKYGFKSIKSVVRIALVEERPLTSWEERNPEEYGFYANVNPEVDHPRWSQARERRLGESGRRETLMFNGYAEEVANLYSGMDLQRHY
ncbi:protein-methionine-sulfoxide reductase catalytic subunit MsrP [Billgrantia kenyensis]|uniref:Protein-methionine-sulfoxide reductase catalytic subunit MsrP n=1 Tax=Billgrantia kenyensis TaxID=321266 RepID=A0A7V9VY95_9GAMM|nr:protein-methionine-sulfoxide reductase catalytic subunit MsrP [Halomonas kenyensis]MBA2777587.1 protein-methionine-sulfoxide reductase catalytic subunit MsrP [Halomonas kenyensis]MCG6660257.1 protein-methionine-sulfoxide reductase catalytic subunit MsrP [Halomonas kenyensis]